MFIISDYIPGQPLTKERLVDATSDQRRRFYAQLIDILAELRTLEFSSAGSLLPRPDGNPEPIMGDILSPALNKLKQTIPSCKSGAEYMAHQFNTVADVLDTPMQDRDERTIRRELFALYSLKPLFEKLVNPTQDAGPFVLSHCDLRCPNILVDYDSLQIKGIIDWEFCSTVPLELSLPPSWITGHNTDKFLRRKGVHAEFCDVLREKAGIEDRVARLADEWYGRSDVSFRLAHILNCPHDLNYIFYYFFPFELYHVPTDEAMAEFFRKHPDLERQVWRQTDQARQYTQYLQESGQYVRPLEPEKQIKEFIAEERAFAVKMGESS